MNKGYFGYGEKTTDEENESSEYQPYHRYGYDESKRRGGYFMKTLFNICNLAGYRLKGDFYLEDKNNNRVVWNNRRY